VVLFVSFAGFMSFGPCYRQALDGDGRLGLGVDVDVRLFRQWVMFSGFGTKVCDVQYYEGLPGGAIKPLNRFDFIGYPKTWREKRSSRVISSAERAVHRARQICSMMRKERDDICKSSSVVAGSGCTQPDVRLDVRCGHAEGWKDATLRFRDLPENSKLPKRYRLDGTHNLCELPQNYPTFLRQRKRVQR